jgi:hypothetical protein
MFGEIIFAVVGRIWEALTTFEFSPDMALSGRAWAFIARLKFVASSRRLQCEMVFDIAPDATDNGRSGPADRTSPADPFSGHPSALRPNERFCCRGSKCPSDEAGRDRGSWPRDTSSDDRACYFIIFFTYVYILDHVFSVIKSDGATLSDMNLFLGWRNLSFGGSLQFYVDSHSMCCPSHPAVVSNLRTNTRKIYVSTYSAKPCLRARVRVQVYK